MAKTILVIDDDPVVVKYLESLLQDNGYETLTASSSKEAMDVLKKTKPDLMTLDLEMPGGWGTQLYRQMTKDENLSDIPVIVVSGMAGRHAIQKAVAYVAKPFDPDKLIAIVRKAIGG
ncbi:MAG: response regulator [Desulfobacterales bacterium]|jgi:CheY-like chemotaxis protein|nr:response regulator [Desulfobacterales bacterium]